MPKRYFSHSRKKSETPFFKILLALLVLATLVFGGVYLFTHGKGTYLTLGSAAPEGSANLLAEARDLLTQGNPAGAAEKVKPLLRSADPVIGPQAVILQADIDDALGRGEAAVAGLEKAVETFKNSTEYPALLARYGRSLEKAGKKDEASKIYEGLRNNAPPDMKAAGLAGLARLKEAENNPIAVRDLYRAAVETATWGGSVWNEAVDPLGKLNVQLAFSPGEAPESRWYSVEKGDSITSIGIKLNTPQGMLMRANNLPESPRLSLGQRLKYTPKDFTIILERGTCQLFLMDTKGIFKRYHVGLGMPGHETTLGKFTIGNKQKDPTWFKPGMGPVASGDSANELGTRWMPLVPSEPSLPTDLGIHGTIHPETVGTFSSHGCARMHNEEVEELYDLVVRSTPVYIVEKYDPLAGITPPATSPPASATPPETSAKPATANAPVTTSAP